MIVMKKIQTKNNDGHIYLDKPVIIVVDTSCCCFCCCLLTRHNHIVFHLVVTSVTISLIARWAKLVWVNTCWLFIIESCFKINCIIFKHAPSRLGSANGIKLRKQDYIGFESAYKNESGFSANVPNTISVVVPVQSKKPNSLLWSSIWNFGSNDIRLDGLDVDDSINDDESIYDDVLDLEHPNYK